MEILQISTLPGLFEIPLPTFLSVGGILTN